MHENHDNDDRRRDDSETETKTKKRDASADWRREYRYQGVDPDHEPDLRADGGDRPAKCECWDATGSLPCFNCYAAGFETPNPEEPAHEADTDAESGSDTPREAEAATDGGSDVPDTHQLADRLGVREELLRSFARAHSDPTAAVVLGWAHDVGELEEPPAGLEDVVEEWLVARGHLATVDGAPEVEK